jgi:hypothetical protein
VWAGNIAKDAIGDPIDPSHDVEVDVDAVDALAPSAVAGVLVAPADTRVELAASVGWASTAHVSGAASAANCGCMAMMPALAVSATGASGSLDLRQPITMRTGARWVGERWIAELDADLWWFSKSAEEPVWTLRGIRVSDTQVGANAMADLDRMPSRASARTHGAVRAAVDAELVAGYLWATAGYAYTTSGTAGARMSPTFGEIGGHTLALGLETSAGGFTITMGWARTWSVKEVDPASAWQLDNPFHTGDSQVPYGTYDGSSDLVGIAVDAELSTD